MYGMQLQTLCSVNTTPSICISKLGIFLLVLIAIQIALKDQCNNISQKNSCENFYVIHLIHNCIITFFMLFNELAIFIAF